MSVQTWSIAIGCHGRYAAHMFVAVAVAAGCVLHDGAIVVGSIDSWLPKIFVVKSSPPPYLFI